MKTVLLASALIFFIQFSAFANDTVTLDFERTESAGIKVLELSGDQARDLMQMLPERERSADGSVETSGTIRCSGTAQPGVGIRTGCFLVIQ